MRNPNIRDCNVNINGNQHPNTKIMRLQKIINSINSELAKKCYDNGELSACVDHVTKNGYIEVELDYGNVDVTIWHNNNSDNECPNMAGFIKKNIDLGSINSLIEELDKDNDWQDDPKYT